MTSFVDFCRIHGVEIDRVPDVGVWRRYRTTDKPSHRNGAVKYMGDHGFCQNHATMVDVVVWRAEGESREAMQRVQAVANHAAQETLRAQQRAADKAAFRCSLSVSPDNTHTWLQRVSDERVNVNGEFMLIPMRVGRDVVGVQTINADGEKKFLSASAAAWRSSFFPPPHQARTSCARAMRRRCLSGRPWHGPSSAHTRCMCAFQRGT